MTSSIESILRLSDYRVMKSFFEVFPTADAFDKTMLNLNVDVAVLQSNEAETDMAVQLRVDVNTDGDEQERAGFKGSVVVTGFFDVASLIGERAEDWESVLVYNGVTVLYGTIRTLYADLSAASPVGRIIIPTVNVGDLLNSMAEQGPERAGADSE